MLQGLGQNTPQAIADRASRDIDQYAAGIRAGLRTQNQQFMQPEEEPTQRTARVAYSPEENKYFIGGHVVDANNDTDVAVMSKYAGQEAPLPEGNWQVVDDTSFSQYVQSIRDPGLLTLMGKNFSMGTDEMQQMAGLGLQWLGAEQTGQYLADQEADLQPNQVYSRNFTDIGSTPENGVLDWMAATIGRLGPNVVESAITAGVGAVAGGAATGPAAPAGAVLGAIGGFFGKAAVKKALLEAAKKQLKGEALDAAEKKLMLSAAGMTNAAANAAKTRLAPGAFDEMLNEGLTAGAQAVMKQAPAIERRMRQIGGGIAASTASNIFQQTGAAYGETMADGGEGNRPVSLLVGTLGGLLDTAPELLLAGRLFSELAGDVVGVAKTQRKSMDILKGVAKGRTGRIAGYGALGMGIEGATEGTQEVLQIAANPVLDLNSAEATNRIINAFAAGALMGGVMGGAGGAFAGSLADNKTEANLLLPVSQDDPGYAQYLIDLKKQIGDTEYKKVFAPPQPYTRIMEEQAAEQAAVQQMTNPVVGLQPFAGTQAPLTGAADQTFQVGPTPAIPSTIPGPYFGTEGAVPGAMGQAGPVPTVTPGAMTVGAPPLQMSPVAPPTPAVPPVTGGPMSMGTTMTPAQTGGFGTFEQFQAAALAQAQQAAQAQQGVQQQAAQRQGAQQFFGSQAAPAQPIPTGVAPGTAPALPIADVVRGVPTTTEARRRVATDRIVANRQAELARGRAQQFVAGPQRQPIAQTPMGAGMQATYTPEQLGGVTGYAPVRSGTETPTATLQRLQRGKAKGKKGEPTGKVTVVQRGTEDVIPTGTAAQVETLSTGVTPKLTPNVGKASQRIRTFLNQLLLAGKTQFNESDIAKHIFKKLGKVTKLLKVERLTLEQKEKVQRFADTMVNTLKVADRARTFGTGGEEFTIRQEVIDDFRSGPGGADTRTLADVPADRETGEQQAEQPGAGGTAGPRNRGRARQQTAAQEPAQAEQGPAARSETLREEAGGAAKLEEKKPTGRKPRPPKAQGAVAVAPSKTPAELKAEKKAAEKAAKDLKKVDDAIIAANNANADERTTAFAQLVRMGNDEKLSPAARAKAQEYIVTELSPLEQIMVAARLADAKYADLSDDAKADLAADAMEGSKNIDENKVPASELEEVYSAVAQVRKQTDKIKGLAKAGKDTPERREEYRNAFTNLIFWAKGQGISDQAQWTARAYLETYKDKTSQGWAGVEQALKDIDEGRYRLSQFDAVTNPVDENGRPAKGVNPIRAKAIVDKFRSGLAKAPRFYVYKNQADLQRRNPELYQRAVAARPQGDFDTAPASGYAFDNTVLVFTDRIPTEKHMRFLLAHEAIGHYGMRALLPAKQFDALMDYVYDNNPSVRQSVDGALGLRPAGVAPMSRRGFLKGAGSVIGAVAVPKMPRIPAKLDVGTFVSAFSEVQEKLRNINNPDSVGKVGDLFLEILSPIKGSDYKQAIAKMDSILDNARSLDGDVEGSSRALSKLLTDLEYQDDADLIIQNWFEDNEGNASSLLKEFSSLVEEAYQKRNIEIEDHLRSTLDMVKKKVGGDTKREARPTTSEDVDMLGARREAVEEYMAKFAEKLDSSILARVWYAIKDVLNKLGVKFEDDIVRYLVSQARSTVRNGSSMFTPSTFALNLQTVMTNNGTGRFSQDSVYSAQHSLRNQLDLLPTPPASMEEATNTLRDLKIDNLDRFERFVRKFLRLGTYNALRNHGANIAEHLKDAMRTNAAKLYNTYNERLAKLLALTGNSRLVVSYALVISRRIASPRFKLDKELRNAPLLILGDERLDGSGRDTKVDEDVLKRLLAIGTLSKKELEDGAEITYEEAVEGNKTKKTTEKIKGLKEELKRELTDDEYDRYVETMRNLADLHVERLKAQFDNYFLSEKVSTKGINRILANKEVTGDDAKFVKDIVNHAKKLFVDDMEYDERGLPDVTTKTAMRMEQFFKAVNTAIVKKEFTDDLKKDVREFYFPKPTKKLTKEEEQARAEALAKGNEKSEAAIKKIEEFRSRRKEFTGLEEQSVIYTVQDKVKEIVLADAAFERAQMFVRRSIASSHVPLWREGKFQVRVEAQINGRTVQLHPDVQSKMIYSLAPKLSDAENQAAFYNDAMKDIEYSGLVRDDATGEYKTQTFKLFARASQAVDTVSSDPSLDIDNFLYVSRVLGIPLAPDKHAKAITMLTAPGSALRKSLKFDDSPGYDPSRTIDAVARHVTTRSSLIVKTRFQPLLRDLMDQSSETGKKWFGDKEAVITAKERLDAATDQKQKDYWQDRLTKELYMYVITNPGAKGWDGSRSTFNNQPTKASLGMRFYSDTVKDFDAINDAPNINESTFEGKRYAALAKMITSVGFLGGVMTQFAQNIMSFYTNVLPFLASKDSQTGFGGGFGMAVMPMYLKSFKDVVGWRGLNPFSDPIEDAKAFEKAANEIKAARDAGNTAKEAELIQQYGLTYYEALNIAREIREGKLIPAQANALLETARGMFTGAWAKGFLKFSDWYMAPFNVSEQATRRATFLTAFRLEFNRLKEAGFAEDKASEMARLFAVDTVDKTLGEYSNTNRPPMWRDGWMSLLFVYKTYPLTSLSLFKNLSRGGKLGMLTALYVLAGAAGFPLVDDIEDFIDTLSQRLGLDLGQGPAVRMAIVRQLEEVFPGWSDFILRGPMNHYTGMDVGAKFGLEDFIPGTGIFLKGANTTQELKSIAGPVIGMGLSIGEFVYAAGRAPLSSTTNLLDVSREAPFSLVRAIGDSVAYMQNGAIVDRRGYIVSPEVSAMTVASRILGFYPADAARQYDFIKYANRMNYDYKEVGTAYKLAWVKAMMTGDRAQAARIVREVNDWNEANKGGPGVIRNFLRNAQKALQEARRPAGERLLKSAPVASRASLERFLDNVAPPE